MHVQYKQLTRALKSGFDARPSLVHSNFLVCSRTLVRIPTQGQLEIVAAQRYDGYDYDDFTVYKLQNTIFPLYIHCSEVVK